MMTQRRRTGHDKVEKYYDPEMPGLVSAKQEISVPKQFVLYQISKNLDSNLLEQSILKSGNAATSEVPGS